MRNILLILILIGFNFQIMATTFIPVPIKKQIAESSGIVQGEVIATNSFEDEQGRILTKVFLRTDKWIGITPNDYHLEVVYPGGQIGDNVQSIHGAPQFEIGEKVVLLLKEDKNQVWIQNLALGKFMVKKYGLTDVLINSVFPNHPKVGQIPLNTFYDLVANIKREKFKERFKDKYEIEVSRQKRRKTSREIASTIEQDEERQNHISTNWLLILFGLLGALFSLLKHSKKQE